MAGFQTHVGFSTLLGIGYGGVACGFYDVPLPTSVLAGGMCAVAGMLPDIDSGSGRPLRESSAFAAAIVPMMMVERLQRYELSCETIILAGALTYLFIRFVVGEALRRYTVHRGMFHSLPAAIVAGELAFLLSSGDDIRLRLYKAGGVVLGYLSHLVLDELYSIEWHRGRLRLKQSFGSAVKLFGKKFWPNVSTFAKLAVLSYVIWMEPEWTIHQHHQEHTAPAGNRIADQAIERVLR